MPMGCPQADAAAMSASSSSSSGSVMPAPQQPVCTTNVKPVLAAANSGASGVAAALATSVDSAHAAPASASSIAAPSPLAAATLKVASPRPPPHHASPRAHAHAAIAKHGLGFHGAALVHTSKHRPLVVCGPSGVGKGTLLTRLLREYPSIFAKSISHTTRAPRAGEVNGQHYHFTRSDELLASVARGEFLEHACVHGNYYGTSISSVAAVMDSGKICLLEIDLQGLQAVRAAAALNPSCIFVRAPTFQHLVDRLNGRGSESEETMAKRLDTARGEMDFFYTNRHMFDADLINDELEDSYQRLIDTIAKLYPHVPIKQQQQQQAQTPKAEHK